MTRGLPAPSAIAARTKSRDLSDSVAPRTMRATVVQPTSATSTMMRSRLIAGESATARRDAELLQIERREHDEQRQERQRDHAVGEAHQHRIEPAAAIAGDKSDRRAEDRGDQRGDDADEQRDPPAFEQPQQQIAADLVGAERVERARARRGGDRDRPCRDRGRSVPRRGGAPNAGDDEKEQHAATDGDALVMETRRASASSRRRSADRSPHRRYRRRGCRPAPSPSRAAARQARD